MNINRLIDVMNVDLCSNGYHQLTHERWGSVCQEEGLLLYSLVRCYRPEFIIETGCGYSTLYLAQALSDNGMGEMVTLDFDGFGLERAKEWLSDALLERMCQPILTECLSWLGNNQRKVDFAWLDSCHDYEHVLKEMCLIHPRMSETSGQSLHMTPTLLALARQCRNIVK